MPYKQEIKKEPLLSLPIKQESLSSIKQEDITESLILLHRKKEVNYVPSSFSSLEQEHKKQKKEHKTTISKSFRKTKTAKISIDECVKTGIRKVGISKGSFVLDEVIIAIKNELNANQHTFSLDNISTLSKQQLDLLSDTGSLISTTTRGVTRYHVIE